MRSTDPPLDSEPAAGPGLSRRTMLNRSARGLGIVLGGAVPGLLGGADAASAQGRRHGRDRGRGHGEHAVGYGPLVDDPAGMLSLPEGFGYDLVAQSGVSRLESGELMPDDPDGTAAFQRRGGGSVLVVNHEIGGSEAHKVPQLDGLTFDAAAHGGTTTIEVDRHGRVTRHYVSLAGTLNNCAGGRTPWETWITCEETDKVLAGTPHGYCFEVDPHDEAANRDPRPIRCLGRFAHESVVVDPDRHAIYQTEDAGSPNGLLYRWTPPADALALRKGSLRALAPEAGTLEAMRAYTKRGELVADLSVATEPGTTYRVRWANVPERDAKVVPVRTQIARITRSRKLEGMWWGDGGAYVVASFARASDGSLAQHDGQVWFLDPDRDTIELKLWFAYTPADRDGDPDGPDTITVSAYGGVIIAEDGEGKQHLVGATQRGETFFLARNDDPAGNEFTGPTFSRDRRTLFANVQSPGRVFAITGPFRRQR